MLSKSFVFAPMVPSDTLVCSFTSLGGPHEPAKGFEWLPIFERYDFHTFHCLDKRQAWYLGGVEGLADTPEGVAEAIRAYVKAHEIKRIITIGSSMGGYASLLIGGLLGADLSIAMAPQSRTGVSWSTSTGDERWLYRFVEMEAQNLFERDIVTHFELGYRPKEAVTIVDSSDSLDVMHAIRVSPYSRLVDLRGSGHNVARDSIKLGLIDQLIGV